jgi:hypothetical protein
LNSITAHPKLAIFGIGFAITFVVGIAVGMAEHGQITSEAFAHRQSIHQHNHASQF